MSVETVKARLAQIQAGITGVKRAFSHGPGAMPPGDLPCFVNFTGPARHDFLLAGNDQDIETRTYIMRLYVRPVGQGIDGEAERLCEPFFPRVRDIFAGRPGLGLGTTGSHLAGVQRAIFLGDSGTSVLRYNGQDFIGIEFRLEVSEYVEVVYEDYE